MSRNALSDDPLRTSLENGDPNHCELESDCWVAKGHRIPAGVRPKQPGTLVKIMNRSCLSHIPPFMVQRGVGGAKVNMQVPTSNASEFKPKVWEKDLA